MGTRVKVITDLLNLGHEKVTKTLWQVCNGNVRWQRGNLCFAEQFVTQSRTRYSFFQLQWGVLEWHLRNTVLIFGHTQNGIVKVHLCVGTQELWERYRLISAAKIGKGCPVGTENMCAPRGNKNRGNRGTDWLRVTWSFPLMLRNGLQTTVFWGLN